MKRKAIFLIGIVLVLLICIIAYFRPLLLSNTASENSKISMILNEYVIINGEPDINVVEYNDVTAEQKSAILTLLDQYTYRRTIGTLFSNGTMSGIGNKMLSIYVFGDDTLSGGIFVASTGKIVVNNKNYRMENAEQFVEQIIEIMEQTD